MSANPMPKTAALDSRGLGIADVPPDSAVSNLGSGVDLRGRVGSGSTAIAAAALRSLALIVIATLLVLVVLPAALVAAGP